MESEKFIDISRLIKSKNPRLLKWLPKFVINYLKRILHQEEINDFLKEHKDKKNLEFCDEVMNYFNIKVHVKGIENIPATGPVILVMNHPLGGMDGIAFISGIMRYRPDLKFIVNDLLMNVQNLKDLFVGVNKHGKNNVSVRAQIKEVFDSSNALCIFPAGLVSRKNKGKIEDLDWKKTFVTYARSLDRKVVPVFIDGKLSPFFYRLYRVRKFLGVKANIEMLYLSNELFKQRDQSISFYVGPPVQGKTYHAELPEFKAAQEYKKLVYSLKKEKE
jgi:putative hemolysin